MLDALKSFFGLSKSQFSSSKNYWQDRYAKGGNSGDGAYSHLADFKAEILNGFVVERSIHSVIEFGCGDGNQLRFASYPQYFGFDVSPEAIALCQKLFLGDTSKTFDLVEKYDGTRADLAMSLDVIFHLVEDDVFDRYMRTLFSASSKYVVIYASNSDDNSKVDVPHVKHREFTKWVASNAPDWKMIKMIPNKYPFNGINKESSFADFYFFEK
jgi:SAM-dependent methyltransferase